MGEELTREVLEAAHCWEAGDRVPGDAAMTDFRRRARLHQARWRESEGLPIGTQPIRPRPGTPSRPVGSRLALDHARRTGANFVTPAALEAVKARARAPEPHQMWDDQRLWADLLWSPTLAFNLFGDLAADLVNRADADPDRADQALHAWWPDVPGRARQVRFQHSPGRLDPGYLGNLVRLDAAIVVGLADGTQGIVGISTRYHESYRPQAPKPERLARYLEVTQRSGAFGPGAVDAVDGTDLIHLWLEHALVLSMLQHPSGAWSWGRLVVVHPAANTNVAAAVARYRRLLTDPSTFASATLDDLLADPPLPASSATALRRRYLVPTS